MSRFFVASELLKIKDLRDYQEISLRFPKDWSGSQRPYIWRSTAEGYYGPPRMFERLKQCFGCGIKADQVRIEIGWGGPQAGWGKPRTIFYGMRLAEPVRFTIDHTQPISVGGVDLLHNRQPMCQTCNNFKGSSWSDRPLMWVMRRLIEARYSRNGMVPAAVFKTAEFLYGFEIPKVEPDLIKWQRTKIVAQLQGMLISPVSKVDLSKLPRPASLKLLRRISAAVANQTLTKPLPAVWRCRRPFDWGNPIGAVYSIDDGAVLTDWIGQTPWQLARRRAEFKTEQERPKWLASK